MWRISWHPAQVSGLITTRTPRTPMDCACAHGQRIYLYQAEWPVRCINFIDFFWLIDIEKNWLILDNEEWIVAAFVAWCGRSSKGRADCCVLEGVMKEWLCANMGFFTDKNNCHQSWGFFVINVGVSFGGGQMVWVPLTFNDTLHLTNSISCYSHWPNLSIPRLCRSNVYGQRVLQIYTRT